MHKKHIVRLTNEERETLRIVVRKLKLDDLVFDSLPLECCSSGKSEKTTVNRGKRAGKRRLFAKPQHFTG